MTLQLRECAKSRDAITGHCKSWSRWRTYQRENMKIKIFSSSTFLVLVGHRQSLAIFSLCVSWTVVSPAQLPKKRREDKSRVSTVLPLWCYTKYKRAWLWSHSLWSHWGIALLASSCWEEQGIDSSKEEPFVHWFPQYFVDPPQCVGATGEISWIDCRWCHGSFETGHNCIRERKPEQKSSPWHFKPTFGEKIRISLPSLSWMLVKRPVSALEYLSTGMWILCE